VRRRPDHGDREQRPGAGADGLRIVRVGGVTGDDDTGGTEGVRRADQGADVAGRGRAVEHHDESVVLQRDPGQVVVLCGHDGEQLGRLVVLLTELREEIRALDPDLPLFNIRTMEQNLAQQRWPLRVFGTMFAVFAFVALVLSAVGLYAITAYSVTQRTQEIGIRMALGATVGRVQLGVIGNTVRLALVGIVLGTAASYLVARGIAALLFGTAPTDPITFAGMILVLGSVALLAGYIPARRASRINPMVALRNN